MPADTESSMPADPDTVRGDRTSTNRRTAGYPPAGRRRRTIDEYNPLLLVLGIMLIIVGIRRLHDPGRNGWYILLQWVPLVNIALWLYMLIMPGQQKENQWG